MLMNLLVSMVTYLHVSMVTPRCIAQSALLVKKCSCVTSPTVPSEFTWDGPCDVGYPAKVAEWSHSCFQALFRPSECFVRCTIVRSTCFDHDKLSLQWTKCCLESRSEVMVCYRVLQNGCRERHSTHDSTLTFEPTFGSYRHKTS